MKYYHHNFQQTPQYKKLNIMNNNKTTTIAVLDVSGNVFATATEKNKKKAEQLASKNALIKLGELDPDLIEN